MTDFQAEPGDSLDVEAVVATEDVEDHDAIVTPLEPEVQEAWDEFWAPILMVDGELDLDQVKRELHDYSIVLEHVPKVYMHISHGKLSKPTYTAETMIREADEFWQDAYDEGYVEGLRVGQAE